MKETEKATLVASKEVDLEADTEKIRCVCFMNRMQAKITK